MADPEPKKKRVKLPGAVARVASEESSERRGHVTKAVSITLREKDREGPR